ncbi:hypothetical protein G7Z17_g8028 [Cylindrodendrum hubeiense]|uniref:Zn(2)-C6 fungal-type domain-containing protein n=1 Tax=Cylindrodendrum hubeiense TaxID=595255 RepID=A0A9P5LDL5_9HYPO|nr:hypothetical protein G7Z17_g8028 [Cylindrodendrum hubeiense]
MPSPTASNSHTGDIGSASPPNRSNDGLDRPAPLACTECRRKHVKCDASVPICLRCTASGSQCHYLPSRRGLKRRADNFHRDQAVRPGPGPSPGPQLVHPNNPSLDLHPQVSWGHDEEPHANHSAASRLSIGSRDQVPDFQHALDDDSHGDDAQDYSAQASQSEQANIIPTVEASPLELSIEDDDALINLFYANFHTAHPLLVPRSLYTTVPYPSYLKLVVHFIGGHFSSMASSDELRSATGKALAEVGKESHRTFHLVQAFLLFSIALHARNEIKESVSILAQAVSLALDIGMNKESFSRAHGRQSAIEEESLRRTWWELYVTDGFMAALQRKTGFRCHGAGSDVGLPCDESLYVEGAFLMDPPSLAQFDARIYMDEELHFSSFCYRIEAIRILARSLGIAGTHEVHEDQVQAIDNALAAWPHHLGQGSTEATNSLGDVDEMLFQAQMLIQYTIISLHFPRSDLVDTIPAASDIIRQRHVLPVSSRTMHGVKAIEASKQLGNLAALRVPVQKHTPFFICGVVFSVIVQLSACSLRPASLQEQCQDRISLIIGVLKTLSPTWALAQVTLRKIKRMALDALSVKVTRQNESPRDSGIDGSTPGAELQLEDLPWLDLLSWGPGTGTQMLA